MATKVNPPKQWIERQVKLPASKSISNRLLIIRYLCDAPFAVENLSDSDDTNVLYCALEDLDAEELNVGHAGTAMRFLTALLCLVPGTHKLKGSLRMHKRPIGPLVMALTQLGANIQYAEADGFPPLLIQGGVLIGGRVELPGNVSSQFISALMLIAPYMQKGMTIDVQGPFLSQDYVQMTAGLMRKYGADVTISNRIISVLPGRYKPANTIVESDWSAASYWFEMVAMEPAARVLLPGLLRHSLQGDSKVRELYEPLGVKATFTDEGLFLEHVAVPALSTFAYDFSNQPDLAQTLAVTLCALNIPFRFSGLDNLRIKETDRIAALCTELLKFGYNLDAESEGSLQWEGDGFQVDQQEIFVATYEDHRMAMAFAPLALQFSGLVIMAPGVVTKSYPGYWDDLFNVGFRLKRI